VDGENRVAGAERPAAIDDFLRAPLDLGVAALHRVEVEVGRVGARRHRRGRAAAMPMSMAGPPIWTSSAPAGTSALCDCAALMFPTPRPA